MSSIVREADLAQRAEPWQKLQQSIADLGELIATDDPSLKAEIKTQIEQAEKDFNELKKELRFQGPYDDHDVILSIHAGAGGTDAQDWTQMLLRMYVRWAEKNHYDIKTIDESAGDEAGTARSVSAAHASARRRSQSRRSFDDERYGCVEPVSGRPEIAR